MTVTKRNHGARELIASAINGLTSHVAILDAAGTIVEVNDAWRQFALQNGCDDPKAYLGSNYLDVCSRSAATGDKLAEEAIAGIASVISGASARFTQRYPCDAPDTPRWFAMTVTPVASGSGVVVAHEDVTMLARAETALAELERRLTLEEGQRVLAQETEHRAKNLLTIVLAIARQTALKHVPSSSAEEFTQRVEGLAASLRLLTCSGWKGVSLPELIRSQLAPFAGSLANRVALEGPELSIQATAAQALGMAFHELATNSLKYGALACREGRISVHWHICQDGREHLVHLVWSECGGPEVKFPFSAGFGYTVTVTAVEAATCGKAVLEYPSQGLVWKLAAPLEAIVLSH
ncbi:MAG: HWE histidine kinase domain-containing protein [Rhodomicrobium sp.]